MSRNATDVGRWTSAVVVCAAFVCALGASMLSQSSASAARRPRPATGGFTASTPLAVDSKPMRVEPRDPCSSLILDGGFETGGIPSTIWNPETSTHFGTPICNFGTCGDGGGSAPARTGSYWAWFGGVAAPENATLGQTVTLASSSSASLTFWLRIGAVSSPFTDVLNVKVDGVTVQSYTEPAAAEGAYTQRTINLNAYANGASHLILFEYIGPSSGIANFTVDDVALTVCGLPPPAGKEYTTSLSSVQEVPPPPGATGSGIGLVTINPAETDITVALSYTGMSSTVISAHIHGPSAPGTNGPIIFDLVPSGGTTGTNTITNFVITSTQLAQLRQAQLYMNVHTTTNPAGEIRGQLHLDDNAANADLDGKTDAAVFRPGDGVWYTLRSSDGVPTFQSFGAATDTNVPGDYDGDGKFDVAMWRSSTATWFIRRSSDSAIVAATFGASTDIPAPADYDKDGKTDIAVFRPGSGDWYILRTTDGVVAGLHWGLSGDRPMPADYDRDNIADVAVFRPSNGTWYVSRSSTGPLIQQFGLSTDKAAAADYDGDGRADMAVFRASTGFWYIKPSNNPLFNSLEAYAFGTSTDLPVPGDYDSDGKTDVAVFRPADGNWYIRGSFLGTMIVIPWGLNGDVPVPTIYVK